VTVLGFRRTGAIGAARRGRRRSVWSFRSRSPAGRR